MLDFFKKIFNQQPALSKPEPTPHIPFSVTDFNDLPDLPDKSDLTMSPYIDYFNNKALNPILTYLTKSASFINIARKPFQRNASAPTCDIISYDNAYLTISTSEGDDSLTGFNLNVSSIDDIADKKHIHNEHLWINMLSKLRFMAHKNIVDNPWTSSIDLKLGSHYEKAFPQIVLTKETTPKWLVADFDNLSKHDEHFSFQPIYFESNPSVDDQLDHYTVDKSVYLKSNHYRALVSTGSFQEALLFGFRQEVTLSKPHVDLIKKFNLPIATTDTITSLSLYTIYMALSLDAMSFDYEPKTIINRAQHNKNKSEFKGLAFQLVDESVIFNDPVKIHITTVLQQIEALYARDDYDLFTTDTSLTALRHMTMALIMAELLKTNSATKPVFERAESIVYDDMRQVDTILTTLYDASVAPSHDVLVKTYAKLNELAENIVAIYDDVFADLQKAPLEAYQLELTLEEDNSLQTKSLDQTLTTLLDD